MIFYKKKLPSLKQHSIRQKLLFSITILLLSIYLIVCIIAAAFFDRVLTDQLNTDNQTILDQSKQQIESMLNLIYLTAQQVITDEEITQEIYNTNKSEYPVITMSHVNRMLQKYSSLNPYTTGISMITPGYTFCSKGIAFSDIINELYNTEWFSNYRNSKNNMIISPIHKMWISNAYKDGISLIYKYHNLGENQGDQNYLLLDIPLYEFQAVILNNILITDSHQQTIVSSGVITAGEINDEASPKNIIRLKDYIVFKSNMDENNWSFYLPVQRDAFNEKIYSMVALLILVFMLSLFITLAILSQIISRITSPVNTIKTAMQNAYQGNLDVFADVKSGDELEFLADCFNKLIKDLKEHIQKIIENEEIRKQIQSDLMLSQIHPHFIYNTLNSVIYLIEEERNEEATEILYSLITILQNVVKLGNHQIFTTIRDELVLLKAYIQIEKTCYPDRFTINIDSEDILYDEAIPQIIIQPLVENALFHGILPCNRPGKINIRIFRENSHIVIIIEDNGIGIEEKNMDVLMDQTSSTVHGIGLSNIKNRIKFLYNALDSEFTVSSVPGKGTTIRIVLPLDKVSPMEQ